MELNAVNPRLLPLAFDMRFPVSGIALAFLVVFRQQASDSQHELNDRFNEAGVHSRSEHGLVVLTCHNHEIATVYYSVGAY
jgi:hypothetical protein